jgi:hypothetical protein
MSAVAVRTLPAVLLALLAVGQASDALAQETTVPVELKAAADPASKSLGRLPAKSPLKILKREGFWIQVESSGGRGWIKASTATMGSASSGLSGLSSGREGKGNIVSTSAARGLSSKELVAAKPDFNQVEELQRSSVDSKAAEAFASSGKLGKRSVALLAAPSKSSEPSPAAKQKKPSKASKDEDEDDDE